MRSTLLTMALLCGCSGSTTGGPQPTDTPTDTGTPGTTATGDPLVVDGIDYWPVLVTLQPDPNLFRLQVNYADAAGLQSSPTEPGQNSTFAVTLSAVDGPAASTSYDWTDSRFPTDPSVLSGYATFFFGTGHPHAGANFLSPASGAVDVTLEAGRWRSDLDPADWSDEAGTADPIRVEGTLDFAWSP